VSLIYTNLYPNVALYGADSLALSLLQFLPCTKAPFGTLPIFVKAYDERCEKYGQNARKRVEEEFTMKLMIYDEIDDG